MSVKQVFALADETDVTEGTDQEDPSVYRVDPANLRDLVFELRGTKNTGTSLDVKIQDSFDDGTTWTDVFSFTQLTADGSEGKAPGRPVGGTLRVLRTSVGDSWDYRVKMSSNPI